MVEDIRKSFEEMLMKVQWMDSGARRAGYAKAAAIKKDVGYPKDLINNYKFNNVFRKLRVKRNTYFANTISQWGAEMSQMFKKLGASISIDEWHILPTTVNAFYEPSLNRISIPAAILQKPFYHKDHPKYLNFAGIGYVIGHELTHGFDNSGKNFDLNGKRRQWWSAATIKKYGEKAQCFVNQYNRFYVPEVRRYVDGKLTLNENLADNGGILESFRAYRTYINKLGREEPVLPGLGLSPNQLFYLNSAQVWCGKVIKDTAWYGKLKGVHSPGRYRVWGSLMNSPEFHKAFSCSVGKKMNPTSKCHMW